MAARLCTRQHKSKQRRTRTNIDLVNVDNNENSKRELKTKKNHYQTPPPPLHPLKQNKDLTVLINDHNSLSKWLLTIFFNDALLINDLIIPTLKTSTNSFPRLEFQNNDNLTDVAACYTFLTYHNVMIRVLCRWHKLFSNVFITVIHFEPLLVAFFQKGEEIDTCTMPEKDTVPKFYSNLSWMIHLWFDFAR